VRHVKGYSELELVRAIQATGAPETGWVPKIRSQRTKVLIEASLLLNRDSVYETVRSITFTPRNGLRFALVRTLQSVVHRTANREVELPKPTFGLTLRTQQKFGVAPKTAAGLPVEPNELDNARPESIHYGKVVYSRASDNRTGSKPGQSRTATNALFVREMAFCAAVTFR